MLQNMKSCGFKLLAPRCHESQVQRRRAPRRRRRESSSGVSVVVLRTLFVVRRTTTLSRPRSVCAQAGGVVTRNCCARPRARRLLGRIHYRQARLATGAKIHRQDSQALHHRSCRPPLSDSASTRPVRGSTGRRLPSSILMHPLRPSPSPRPPPEGSHARPSPSWSLSPLSGLL